MKTLFSVSLLLFLSISTFAQQNQCACCDEKHQQFDFWVGEWEVTDTAGNAQGKNTITKIEDGCTLQEKWVGAKGTTGTSLNYYNPSDSTWNQLWIDKNGTILKLKGHYIDNKMVLKSELTTSKKGQQYYNQITWTKIDDNTVSQLWDIYTPGEKKIQTLFLGIYKRKEE